MSQPHLPVVLYYQSIPSLEQWQKDRGGLSGVKGKPDRVLHRIDILVKSLGRAKKPGNRSYLLCELYFSANYWIRNVGPALPDKQHAAPVAALFDCVQRQLANVFKCPGLMVAAKLQQHYCCCENAHGIFCDEYDVPHSFQNRGETEKFSFFFVNGLAMWNPWWEQGPGGLVKVNTSEAYKRAQSGTSFLRPDAAFFVMNRYRDMYAAPHFTRNPDYPMYHSSIPKGQSVQFAGSIVIKNGKITEIRNDSGHYKPHTDYVLNVLEQLKTVGAKGFNEIVIYDFDNKPLGTAEEALEELKNGQGWEGIKNRAEKQRDLRKDMAAAIKGRERGKRLKELELTNGRDKALETLFAEQFDRVRQGMPGSFRLWEETWKDVLNSLMAFYSTESGVDSAEELGRWLRAKEKEYRAHSPVAPLPSKGGRPSVSKPGSTSPQDSYSSRFQQTREAFEKGTIWHK